MCFIGSAMSAFFCTLTFVFVFIFEPSLTALVIMILMSIGTIAISGPIAASVFMEIHRDSAGTASASMGISRVLFSALAGFIVTFAHNESLLPTTGLMCIISATCFYYFRSASLELEKNQC